MTNEQSVTIEEELHLVHQDDPTFLAYFLTLMETGKIYGEGYGEPGMECACFYGHRFRDEGGTTARMDHTWFFRQRIGGSETTYTPIEELIRNVKPDETPEDNLALSTLKTAIEQVLLSVTI